MIKIKNINLILLSILLNNNINSMQPKDVKEKKKEREKIELSNLPEEARQYIIYQMIAPYIEPYINRIKNIDNIFDLYSLDLSQIKKVITKELMNLLSASKASNASALGVINHKRIIEKKEEELTDNIKSNYEKLDTQELNNNLQNILDQNIIDRNDLQEATRLIIAGANLDTQDRDGNTALMISAQKGHIDIVKLLLNKKADPDIKDNNGHNI